MTKDQKNKKVREVFVDNVVYGNVVDVSKALTLNETLEVDGVQKYAGLKIAPKIVISPMSRDELIQQFGEKGVPIKYYNHIKRLSEHRQSQIKGQRGYQFASVNVYDDHMESDHEKTDKMKQKIKEEGYSILDMGKF